jgi:putative lipoic acid-binding regulatory protein
VAELIGGPGLDDDEPPKIEFPCAYPVKVLGRQTEEFSATVLSVVHEHAPGFDEASVSVRSSRKGRFVSLTVTITATGPEQLDAMHQDLLATGLVQMVL